MKKNDVLLIVIVLLISLIMYVIFVLINSNQSNLNADVLINDELVITIDLKDNSHIIYDDSYISCIDDTLYTFNGTNGDVVLEVKNSKIRVVSENSPYHICSKQGYTDSSLKPLTCLPNNLVVVINSNYSELDSQLR